MYESDLTKFMRQFLEQHPGEIEEQRKGRALWWDKQPTDRKAGTHGAHSPRSGGNEYTFKSLDENEADAK